MVSALVDEVFRAALCAILETHVQNHLINARFGDGYVVNNLLVAVCRNIEMLMTAYGQGSFKSGKRCIVIPCPKVNALFCGMIQLGGEIVNVLLSVAVGIINGVTFIKRNVRLSTNRASAILEGMLACFGNVDRLAFTARANKRLLTYGIAGGLFGNAKRLKIVAVFLLRFYKIKLAEVLCLGALRSTLD